MKLLGWMHRKFRQNSGDALKELSTGPTFNCLPVSGGGLTEELHQLSPVLQARLNGRPIRGRHLSADEPLHFGGLLSIGTLGSAPIEEESAESETELKESAAAAAAAVESIAEKEETEAATETDLMVVNTELEKVLTEAAEKEGDSRLSSARPSHVSSGKANEACPLQEFLFGAAADTAEAEKEKKEKRASLGELFMIEEGIPRGKGGGEGEGGEMMKKGEAAGVNVMVKKTLKRHGSYRSSISSVSAADTAKDAHHTVKSAKFQKILQIFQRKIHPENGAASKKPAAKYSKYKSKYTTSCSGSNCLNGCGGDQLMTPSKRSCRKGNKCGLDQKALSLDGSNSTSSREHWIKTDADYLVLEL